MMKNEDNINNMNDHDHSHVEESVENPEQLKNWLEHFARQYQCASHRKIRCEELMRRKSAKKWSPSKTSQMVRRLVLANKEIEQSESALDRIANQLSKMGIEVSVQSQSKLTT
jgi:hypothetical protein